MYKGKVVVVVGGWREKLHGNEVLAKRTEMGGGGVVVKSNTLAMVAISLLGSKVDRGKKIRTVDWIQAKDAEGRREVSIPGRVHKSTHPPSSSSSFLITGLAQTCFTLHIIVHFPLPPLRFGV